MVEDFNQFPDWKAYALTELGGIFAGILEYEDPVDIAVRLRAIASDLDTCFLMQRLGNQEPIALPETQPTNGTGRITRLHPPDEPA